MYKIGDEVSYGLHGKCVITAIETKELGGSPVTCYQMRAIKNPIIAKIPGKAEAAILVPVDSASAKGVRSLMTKQDAEFAIRSLTDREYHFELDLPWVSKQKLLEETIRKEGFIGLAKVVGHLYVVIKRDAVPSSIVLKFYESVYRVFLRELSEAFSLPSKDVELILTKALKSKLALDN